MNKITQEQFAKEIKNLVGDEYEILDYYSKNKRMFAKIKHNKCKNIYETARINFIKGSRCIYCSNINKSKSHDTFVSQIEDLYDNKITILGKYKNNKTNILIRHNICNYEFNVRPDNLLSFGEKCCKKCNGILERQENINNFKNLINNILGENNYKILTNKIELYKTPITLFHNECETKFITNLGEIIRGKKCPNCVVNKKKTLETFKQEVYDLVKDEYIVLGEYINTNTRIKMKHNKKECLYEWDVIPKTFLHANYRCPLCNSSKGELIINNFLKQNNFNYKTQYKISDCVYKRSLPFDFAVFDSNNNLKYLIEYDGEQHYNPNSLFHGKLQNEKNRNFEITKLKDKIKTDYCLKKQIQLIRISYNDFDNIVKILNSKLKL